MPMKPLPPLTASMSAVRCAAVNGNSPLVNANITTSTSDNPAALMRLRSSVALIVKPLVGARDVSTSRAVAIASCLKPAVAVSISTRTTGPVGAGAVGAVGVDGLPRAAERSRKREDQPGLTHTKIS